MAARTVYGKSPWGAYFVETLFSHYDEGRLMRGRTYANTGKVAALEVIGPRIEAKVAGHYKPWYKVVLEFPVFSAKERKAILDLIREKPVLLSAIAGGELPMELIDELGDADIDLLPRDWDKLTRRCNCPDDGDPCKHMAAVYYSLAHEIDQNPFSLFLLRGLDLKAEFSLAEAPSLPPPLTFAVRPKNEKLAIGDPELSIRDGYTNFIISVLRPSPAFHSGDFKTILAEFYHKSARRYEAELTVPLFTPKNDLGRHLQEASFILEPASAWEPPADPLWPLLKAEHPTAGTQTATLIDMAPRLLSREEAAGSPGYLFFFYLYRLFFLIVRAGAFIPSVSAGSARMHIIWKPLSAVRDIARQIDALAPLCPPLLRMPDGPKADTWADGQSTVDFLLAALCTQYVRRLEFSTNAGKTDPFIAAFFAGATLNTEAFAYRSTPRAVAAWLAVLDQRENAFRYRFDLKASRTPETETERTYRLSVHLAPVIVDETKSEVVWTNLHKAAALPGAVSALSFAVMLGSYLPELTALQTAPFITLEEERLLFFLREAAPVLNRLGVEVRLPKELSRALKPKLTVAAKPKGAGNLENRFGLEQMLDYEWKVAIGDTTYSVKEFEALVKSGRRLVRLKDGFLTLDPDEIRRLLERSGRTPAMLDAVAAYLDGAETFGHEARAACDALFREKNVALPQGLCAELRHYQMSGYRWAWNNLTNGFGCLLADDMGLGKTVQAIALILKLKEENRLIDGTLIVVPASLMTNWRRELERFAPSLGIHEYYGPRREFKAGIDVHLSTYETINRDIEIISERGFSFLILDEAQGLKNTATKRAQSIRSIKSGAKIALSGTPVENRLEDLRAILDLVLPGYLGDAATFRSVWRVPIELHRNEETAAALKRVTSPFLLRRLKTDPAVAPDLPEKTVTDEYATLIPAQAALYESVLAELAGPSTAALDDPRKRGMLVLKLLTALKQVCNHPRAYDGESPCKSELSGKSRLLLDLLASILENGEKVLVFSQYVGTLDLLEELIRTELGEACLILHGGMSAAARRDAVDRFQ
ncbi:MAG: SNF2-related protein, partial [Treponemataceae bacterium]